MAGKVAKRNIGGGTWYQGGNSNVASEAKERKDGGKVTATAKRKFGGRTVGSPSGSKSSGNLGKRARGGRLSNLGAFAHGGKVAARATGGGCESTPFSSAGSGLRTSKGKR